MKKMSPILAIGFAASIAFTVSVAQAQAQNNQAAPTQNGTPANGLATENKTASNKPAHHARVAAHYRHHHRYGAGYGTYVYFGSRYRGANSSADNERRCMLSPGSLNYEPCTNKW